jgi:peroxiredoxin
MNKWHQTERFQVMQVNLLNLSDVKGYKPGDKAADFSLRNVDGRYVSLKDYKKTKGFIVIFTCNHCPYAKAYEKRIMELNRIYGPKGYPVIAINPNDPEVIPADSYENMQQLARQRGFDFPYLFDEEQKVFPVYGALHTPHAFILNREQGDLIVRYIGAIDDNYSDARKVSRRYVAEAVEALLEGRAPDPDHTQAIGCSIKVK